MKLKESTLLSGLLQQITRQPLKKMDGHEDVPHQGKTHVGRVRDCVENLIVHLY